MADLTKAKVLAEVRRLLNEPTANVFTDSMINGWIDIAARNISSITGAIRTVEKLPVGGGGFGNVGKPSFTSSSNFIKIESVRFEDTNNDATPENNEGLMRISPEMYGHVGDRKIDGVTKFYFFWENTVYISPGPSSTETDANAQLTATGPTMVASYGTNLPEYLQYPCVYFVLSCAYTRDGKHRKAALEMQRYIGLAMRYRVDVTGDFDRVDGKETRRLPDRTVLAGQQG